MHAHMRSRFVQPRSTPTSDINVTPLVDVVLVLLIIFMVVTPLMAKELAVQTPETSEGTAGAPAEQQVVVGISAAGEISLDGVPVSEAEYVPRLSRLMAARAPGSRTAFFAADDRASYSRLVAALDGAKRAGVEVLGVVGLSQLEKR